jgi:hypothetical protein
LVGGTWSPAGTDRILSAMLRGGGAPADLGGGLMSVLAAVWGLAARRAAPPPAASEPPAPAVWSGGGRGPSGDSDGPRRDGGGSWGIWSGGHRRPASGSGGGRRDRSFGSVFRLAPSVVSFSSVLGSVLPASPALARQAAGIPAVNQGRRIAGAGRGCRGSLRRAIIDPPHPPSSGPQAVRVGPAIAATIGSGPARRPRPAPPPTAVPAARRTSPY